MTGANMDEWAFPCPDVYRPDGMHVSGGTYGMTLRDYFAGQALANPYATHESEPDTVARWAYQVADAMLRARKEGGA